MSLVGGLLTDEEVKEKVKEIKEKYPELFNIDFTMPGKVDLALYMSRLAREKELDQIVQKAYQTGAINDTEFRRAMEDLFLEEDEYILDTGSYRNTNAEMLLRLKDKHKELHKIFWK